ncbi:hypothetical protein PFISCL1PPCAC_3340, partial [Pristionchus fissidentatus]
SFEVVHTLIIIDCHRKAKVSCPINYSNLQEFMIRNRHMFNISISLVSINAEELAFLYQDFMNHEQLGLIEMHITERVGALFASNLWGVSCISTPGMADCQWQTNKGDAEVYDCRGLIRCVDRNESDGSFVATDISLSRLQISDLGNDRNVLLSFSKYAASDVFDTSLLRRILYNGEKKRN